MENQILDEAAFGKHRDDVDPQEIISVSKFVFLCFITLGIYEVWWMYKSWRFFKQKDKLDIMPAGRAIFAIFFANSLFERSLNLAKEKGYSESYNSVGLYSGFIISNLIANIAQPLWVLSLFSFVFLVPPFKALNYARLNSHDIISEEQLSFNSRQLLLIICGLALWGLVILAMLIKKFNYNL